MTQKKPLITLLVVCIGLLLAACDPLAPAPTPQVIVVTAVPSATPLPTATPAATHTPIPTSTPALEPSATPFPCDEESGQIFRFDSFRSTIAGETLRYRVYVPPCYQQTQRRYPVAFLLHGSGEREDQWEKIGATIALDQGFRLNVLPPMILVMPYFGTVGNDNYFPPDPSFESVLLNELLPAVDRDFCTWNNRDHRALGGISRGGFWAYSIGLRHPDLFGILGGHSAYMTEDLSAVPAPFNPLELVLNSSLLPDAGLQLYLDNGAQDRSGVALQLLSSHLTTRNIPHTYVINPVGDHNDEYWSSHVSEYLAFYGRNWPKDISQLPSCLEPSPR